MRDNVRLFVEQTFRGLVGRFEDGSFVDEPRVDEPDDLYEYLVNHELEYPKPPKFHVCTAEAAAREAVRQRRISKDFQCPRRSDGCPMRRLVAAAGGLDVEIAFVRKGEGGAHG
ncbi:MAG: hypothetical protein HOV80_16130 [Polyangiaceae bacterium]|nr:hypothetical protein [Polyangiaceae bacterium]